MLHFPSASKSAHLFKQYEIAKLKELLGDEVWGFSNCRIDSPRKPIAEVDWLFYNTRLGTLMVCEWKRYPQLVAQATDTGAKWVLEDGSQERNPVEQVSGQQDALRWALRENILGKFFPGQRAHDLRVMQSVYCPQVTSATVKDRLRFGRLFGTLEELCNAVNTVISPEPLLVSDMAAVKELATALGELFRCDVPTTLNEAIGWLHNPKESARFWDRASHIHSQIASLHDQLAQLILEEFVPQPPTAAVPSAVQATAQATPKPVTENSRDRFHDVIHGHAASFLSPLDGQREAFIDGMRESLVAILSDAKIPRDTWISLGIIGAAVKKNIHDGTEFRDLLGTYFWKWCLCTAQESGLDAVVDDVHQNIKVVPAA